MIRSTISPNYARQDSHADHYDRMQPMQSVDANQQASRWAGSTESQDRLPSSDRHYDYDGMMGREGMMSKDDKYMSLRTSSTDPMIPEALSNQLAWESVRTSAFNGGVR